MPTAVEEVRSLEGALEQLDRECAALDQFEVAKEAALERLQGKLTTGFTELERRRQALATTYDERIRAHETDARKTLEDAEAVSRAITARRDKFSAGSLDSIFEPLAEWMVKRQEGASGSSEDPIYILRTLNEVSARNASWVETATKEGMSGSEIFKGGALISFAVFVGVAIFKPPVLININFPVIFPGLGLFICWAYILHPAYLRRTLVECHYRGNYWLKQAESQADKLAEEASVELREERDSRIRQLEAEVAGERAVLEAQAGEEMQQLLDEQEAALARQRAELDRTAREVDRRALALEQEPSLAAWSAHSWTSWSPSAEAVSAVRLGRKTLALPRLQQHFPEVADLRLPALWSLSGDRPLLFSAGSNGRGTEAALGLLVRLLAAQPPGRVRFTIVDPARLGQSVAPLLPLLDLAPELLGGKVLSDPQEIEKALAELTDHLERVIQKCLRHEFADLAAYNAQAGEVAEPYRVLAIWDFPTHWTEASLRRLQAVLRNGPRCGVQTILVANRAVALPHGFTWEELGSLVQELES